MDTDVPATDALSREIALEQAHVDKVYAELAKARLRTADVEADGLARGRTDRVGDVRDEELTGLVERDALVYLAARRRHDLDRQFEGLVFGRLDLDHSGSPDPAELDVRELEARYIGRLGVRDDDYEPLVIDWRAPAAAPFYRATPVDAQGVIRRRVLRCTGDRVVGIEDDLMVAQAPQDLVVIGDGALMAALTRSRGARMRDIVATIQRHQDEAIRAPARGITEITGGPGTGKTVVALHRAAFLLYSDRRRFESGGVLIIGPSPAYTAYIERVLPSLGEESVVLRSIGDLVDGVTATRLDPPSVARIKGGHRIRTVLARVSQEAPPDAPAEFRAFVAGTAIRIDADALRAVRQQVRRTHQHNLGVAAARAALADLAWAQHEEQRGREERAEFLDRFHDSLDVDRFMRDWWPQLDPREPLLWLADETVLARCAHGILGRGDQRELIASLQEALTTGTWSVSDVPLIDDLFSRLGPIQDEEPEERGFFEVEELDNLAEFGVQEVGAGAAPAPLRSISLERLGDDPRDRLVHGIIDRPRSYAHILVDEAQDLSPMQWLMVGRRGRHASWTVVGDDAQSSWPDAAEALRARHDAYGRGQRRGFHMDTNYRNAREIFDYAADVIRREVPDADIPAAVREIGWPVREVDADGATGAALDRLLAAEVAHLLDAVEGGVVIVPGAPHTAAAERAAQILERVSVVDPLSTKGLEYDAVLVLDPEQIAAETPGGIRALYVVLTRAAHRLTVLRP
ncbi:MAG TPA: UvrD-helicase domain-containing protein [Intrasporangiaceae bacterium]|nr:UvrD-helicase domain-containing protein [Intrasporangiaceae bacterium]